MFFMSMVVVVVVFACSIYCVVCDVATCQGGVWKGGGVLSMYSLLDY